MSNYTMGNAAAHILAGDVDAGTLPAVMAACHWCIEPLMTRECWHADAAVLLANGLRPVKSAQVTESVPTRLW